MGKGLMRTYFLQIGFGIVVLFSIMGGDHVCAEGNSSQSPWFKDVSVLAGIDFKHSNRSFNNAYGSIMEGYTALGAAVAVGDYNGDGFDDLFVTDSQESGKNRLYRNEGDFTFTEVGEMAGVADGNDAVNASANALWFDYNGDRHLDLLVVRFGRNLLYENQGDGTFKEVSKQAGLAHPYLNCIVAIAFDYDLDEDLDLFLGNYFQAVNLFDPPTSKFFPESFETANNGGGMTLYRNNGDGTFDDATDAAGLRLSGWTLDLGHADVDHDGDDDLYVAADFGTDRFFLNQGDGTFVDVTEQAVGIDTKKGMNTDWGDFNNDGLFDLFVTNITDEYMREGNFLWQNNGDGTFSDVSRETGTFDTGWGWAGKFFDFDNDGWLDLFTVNGWVSGGKANYVVDIFELIVQPNVDLSDATNWPPMGDKTLSGYQENFLFHNQGGMLFKNEAALHQVNSKLDGRGVGIADFDNDGRLDMYVSNANAKPFLYRNVQPTENHWVQFLLEGNGINSAAIGARIWVTTKEQTLVSFVNGGNGFASQSTLRVHFGLGEFDHVGQVRIMWPSGKEQIFKDVQADQIYRPVEGEKQLSRFKPKK